MKQALFAYVYHARQCTSLQNTIFHEGLKQNEKRHENRTPDNFHIHIVLHVAFFFFFLAFDFCLVYNTVSHKLNMLGVYVS